MTAQNNVTPNDVAQSIVKRVRSLERISFLRSIDRLKNMMAKIVNAAINTIRIVELRSLELMKLSIKFGINYAPFFRVTRNASRLVFLRIALRRMQSS